ncbi:hypothetical protein DFH11DRAFT_1545444 [Phellopilus nigrolimitatus]|nr:hypothetical protein DFH11DRAFT_1545444 [Phellopilus nigrolimitatus]
MITEGLIAYRHKAIPGIWECGYLYNEPSPYSQPAAWLEVARNFFEGEARKFKKYEDGRPKSDKSDDVDCEKEEFFRHFRYCSKPSQKPPSHEEFVGWIYTLDLDLLVFSVDEGAHFRLNNIPRGEDGKKWIYYLTTDGCGRHCLRPDTPREYVAMLVANVPLAEDGLAHYRTFASDITRIREHVWMAPKNTQRLAAHPLPELRVVVYTPTLATLQMLVQFTEKLKAHSFGSEGLQSGDHLRANVGLAVSHTRETGVKSCTVLIFSIHYVAVVMISVSGPDLRVSQSDIYPVLAAYGNDEEQFSKGLGILTYYLRPHCIEDISKFDPPFPPSKTLFTFELPIPKARNKIYVQDPSLPYDILTHIMSLVDSKTYDIFQFVSKALRREWAAHPRISDYTIAGVAAVNMQTNTYLPDVTLNARTRDGLSTSLTVFCTETGVKAFDSETDDESYLVYPRLQKELKAYVGRRSRERCFSECQKNEDEQVGSND